MTDRIAETIEEFQVTTSDFADIVGKTRFTTELTFMKCLSGSAVIAIDSIEHTLAAQHSFILSEYMAFQVKETSSDFSVSCITITLPFYYEIIAVFDGTIFNVILHSAPDLYESSDMQAANLIFENLCLLYENPNHTNCRSMSMNLIACYIYEIYELTLPHFNEKSEKNNSSYYTDTIFLFYSLVSQYGNRNRNIEFYAEKLNMSSRYLYKIVHNTCHITPKQLIDDVVVSLIKQLILTTSQNNQQISDQFSFPDQSAFGQYFKRCTKLSPSEFRERNK
ncbi:MAG: helix-turn-helix domain-containing protein [Bacteroidales bacterium]|nr:helix-turn-helix domain-containing protein [Bacteroidales bacterium]